MTTQSEAGGPPDDLSEKEERILDAVLAVLGRGGVAALSMRAVAAEADVAVGLANYYFSDKTSLVAAALRRLGDEDARLVRPLGDRSAADELRHALRRVTDDEFLRPDYLGLRLHLWSLAPIEPEFAHINNSAQTRYRNGLGELLSAARPDLSAAEVARRAADILVIQNGVWLTSILIVDPDAIERSVQRCEQIAFGDDPRCGR